MIDDDSMLSIHYFASVREAMSRERDELARPGGVRTVSDLINHLSDNDRQFARLARGDNPLLVAVNQTMVGLEHTLGDEDEVAFFPPMTGG